jgi:hypothetical protein
LFFDVPPITREGRLLVPLRPIFEWVGGRVEYRNGEITAYSEDSTHPAVELVIGSREARLNGRPYNVEVAPEVINGRTFVPLRFVAESFGVWVESEGRIVTLKIPQEEREAQMAVAPDPGSHQEKIWNLLGIWYGLPEPTRVDLAALPHWKLFSTARQGELTAQLGREAARVIEGQWGARAVAGIRILADAVDPVAGGAQAQVMVKYADGAVYRDDFQFVLESEGWRVRQQTSEQIAS